MDGGTNGGMGREEDEDLVIQNKKGHGSKEESKNIYTATAAGSRRVLTFSVGGKFSSSV
jgi:hypothetical protein